MDAVRTPFPIAEKFTTPHGHTYFRSRLSVLAGESWAIADETGDVPWETDDGVLWVDNDQPLTLGVKGISLSLLQISSARTEYERTHTTLNPVEAITVAYRLGLALSTGEGDPLCVVSRDAYDALVQTVESSRRLLARLGPR